MVNTISNGEQMYDSDADSVVAGVDRSLEEITNDLRTQYAQLMGNFDLIDSHIDRTKYNLAPEYQGAMQELKRMLRTKSATPEELEEYITAIVKQMILPQEYRASRGISRYYTDMYPALDEVYATSYRSMRNIDFSTLAVGTLLEVEKDNYVQSTFYVWNGSEGINVPYSEVYFLRQMQPEERVQAAKKCEKGERITNGNAYDSFRIINTTADVFIDKKNGQIYRDGRELYKYYLVKDLRLPQEQQDKMVYALLSEYLEQYISSWQSRHNSFGSRDGIQEYELRRLAYHLPIQNQEYIHRLQAQFEKFAPELIQHDSGWELQELCATFNIPQSRYSEYARQAIATILDNAEADEAEPRFRRHGIDIYNLLRLQEKYTTPLTPKQIEQATIVLKHCVGSSNDTPERFCKAFDIPQDIARRSALAEAEELITESMQRNYEPVYERDIGAHSYVRIILDRYNITANEVPKLHAEVTKLLVALQSKEGFKQYTEVLKTSKLRNYLPQLVEAGLLQILNDKDMKFLGNAHEILSNYPEYTNALTKIFGSKNYTPGLFDLTCLEGQKIWKILYERDAKYHDNLANEWLHYIDALGINAERMGNTLQHCSHTAKKREEYNKRQEKAGESDRLYQGNDTQNVATRIMQTLHAIEQVYPGIGAYFYTKHNICMFNRYPIDLLLQVYEDETGTVTPERKKLRKEKKNKGHMLVLYPHTDWNGAFDNHEVLNNIQKDATKQKLTLHIAESGTRTGCLRQLAQCKKEYGALKAAVIGGHADETVISFGPNDEDTLTLEELQNIDIENISPALKKKLEKIQSFFDSNAIIIFKSCSVGKENGIAYKITKLLKRITIGADRPAALNSITLDLAEANYKHGGESKTHFANRLQKLRYAIKRWWKKQ